ncbi:hypothetical protein [Salinisphaera orenii]|uniref:Nucleotidyltransferase n=1 Tax=Salinisphaera orenii YIM 95161 TaxID=1051139 RepID=A0A423PX16_9GAMM|nr:hypothetical protein [Salinisphaera halophila]ROO30150.1 hypothetical protein SAHL_08110 [Salinisphaera halophila YIM 95161]
MASARKQSAQRQHMAQLAARLMAEQGIRDFRVAKQKAAQHLGIDVRNSILPRNSEIEAALAEHHRLFAGEEQPQRLQAMREAAVQAMRLFADFRPRLVGDVLSGLADAHSDIQLHVFAEQSEAFDLFLQGQGIPYEIVDRRYRFAEGHRFYPAFRFVAGEHRFEATLFGATEIREAPRSLVDGAPMARANVDRVERLIADEQLRARLADL